MIKKIISILFLYISTFVFSNEINILEKYQSFNFSNSLDITTFEKAYLGFMQIPERNSNLLVVIDYSKPSYNKRFFVLDMSENKILFHSRVSHSKNSGFETPIIFSNDPNSFQSSLGFYLTLNDYNGKFGHSLKLRGLEENINSNAERRTIVLHGGQIATENYLKNFGFLGRSLGCPVLPPDIVDDVINLIKEGSIVFINGNDESYIKESEFFNMLVDFKNN